MNWPDFVNSFDLASGRLAPTLRSYNARLAWDEVDEAGAFSIILFMNWHDLQYQQTAIIHPLVSPDHPVDFIEEKIRVLINDCLARISRTHPNPEARRAASRRLTLNREGEYGVGLERRWIEAPPPAPIYEAVTASTTPIDEIANTYLSAPENPWSQSIRVDWDRLKDEPPEPEEEGDVPEFYFPQVLR